MSRYDYSSNSVSPPAGTGNAPGLGEAFSLDLNSGQGSYGIALPLPEGVAGFKPQLKLEYRHGCGQGPLGFGWGVPLRSINRRLDYGVPGEGTLERFADGSAEIVACGDCWHTAVETMFCRYERVGSGWNIIERNGVRHELGTTASGRIADPANPDRIVSWLLETSTDTSGNRIEYRYTHDQGIAYIESIRYAVYTVGFLYENRPDVRRCARAGFIQTLRKRCTAVEISTEYTGTRRGIRRWSFTYSQAPRSNHSLLDSVQLRSFGSAADGSDDVVRPPQRFGYSSLDPRQWHGAFLPFDSSSPPPVLSEKDTSLAPLQDFPLPGICRTHGGRMYYWPNTGNGFGPGSALPQAPLVSGVARDPMLFIDADGNGTVDVMVGAGGYGPAGYFENGAGRSWSRFVAYGGQRKTLPPFSSGKVRVADMDGDGTVDALYGAGNFFATFINHGEEGWAAASVQPKSVGGVDAPDADFTDPLMRMADMTGDGLPDVVRIRSGCIEYWPNLGHGRFGPRVEMACSPRLPAIRDPEKIVLTDIDGDGCCDLVCVERDRLTAYINQGGNRWSDPIVDTAIVGPGARAVQIADMTGAGRSGLLWNCAMPGKNNYFFYEFAPALQPYLLSTVENGAGLVSEIEYRGSIRDALMDKREGAVWSGFFPFAVTVVAATREHDTISGRTAESTYRYHDGHYDAVHRSFQGFGRVDKIEKGDASRFGRLTRFHFRLGADRAPGNGPEHAALNRMLYKTEIFNLDGTERERKPIRVEESEHCLRVLDTLADGGMRVWVALDRTTTSHLEQTDDRRCEERVYRYDLSGNVISERWRAFGTENGTDKPEKVTVTEVSYATCLSRDILDRPSRIVKRSASGAILRETHRLYDGNEFSGLPLGTAERGLLTRETRRIMDRASFSSQYGATDPASLGYHEEIDADGAVCLFAPVKQRRYNAAGVITAERSPTGAVTEFTMDAANLFRTAAANTLGTTAYTIDPVPGFPTVITEPDGKSVNLSYDAQGRLRAVALPGDTLALPTREYRYDDSIFPNAVWVRYRSEPATTRTLDTAVYFDGLGKELQRRVEMEPGRIVVSGLVVKNPWGDVAREYEPAFDTTLSFGAVSTDGKPCREIYYDCEGRPVRVVNYNGGESSVEYRPFEIISFDAGDSDPSSGSHGTPRRELLDAARNRIATMESLGAEGFVTTRYEFDDLNQLIRRHDGAGEVSSYTYDGAGNRLTVNHREAGLRRMFYDARPRVTRTVDAAGNDIAASFDPQDRIAALTVNGTVQERYVYDDIATNGLGLLREVSYPGGSQSLQYNRRGQVTSRTWRFDGMPETYTLEFFYDGLGKQRSVTYPDGSVVSSERYANGMVRAIPGYIDTIDYDARMLPVRIDFANGTTTTVEYTAGPGRVSRQRTVKPDGTVIEDQRYGYDLLQQLVEVDDLSPGLAGRVAYTYDPLGQLVECDDERPAAGGTRRYAYAGRRLAVNEETGATLVYGDPTHPGRVSCVEHADGTETSIDYDANGNMTVLPGGRTLFYSAKNELQRVDRSDGATIRYGYDHAGLLIRKQVVSRSDSTDTIMLDRYVEIKNGRMHRFVLLGATRIAVVLPSGTCWMHMNYLGSVSCYSDESGNPVSRIAYLPYGNVAATTGADARRTFALHPWDSDAGLYYMRRRFYSPELGCFTSPDSYYLFRPEKGADDPRLLEVYSYCGNDPINRFDPSGRSFWSVFGAIIGVIVAIVVAVAIVAACAVGIGWGLLAIAAAIGLVVAGYALASATAGSDFGEFMRGFLIGFNAGMNAALWTIMGCPVLGVIIGVIGFLSAFDSIASSEVYQGILGWSNWLMPMSWLVVGLGVVFFILNVLGYAFTFGQVNFCKIDSVSIQWESGTIIMKGGWISNINTWDTAFNMGNFTFVDTNYTGDAIDHEAGHAFNLAAYGSVFHFAGFFDEVAFGNGGNAYAERLADSNDPNAPGDRTAIGDDPIVPQWV